MSDPSDIPALQAPQWVASSLRGPAMVGYMLQLLLFGVFLQQFTSYAASGELREHTRLNRVVLWVSLLLNTTYTGFAFAAGIIGGVSQHRTLDDFYNGHGWKAAMPLISAIISATSQAFLTMRAARLFTNRHLKIAFSSIMSTLIAMVLLGGSVVFADSVLYTLGATPQGAHDADLALPAYLLMSPSCLLDLKIALNTGTAIWLWSSALADISISVALAYNLRQKITGFSEETDSLLRKLIYIGIKTASYTSLLSFLGAIAASIWSDGDLRYTDIDLAFWTPASALHGIALFTFSAGGHRQIAAHMNGHTGSRSPSKGVGAFSPTGPAGRGGIALQTMPHHHTATLGVRVEHQTEIAFDDADDLEEKSDATSGYGKRGHRAIGFDV
ncbi:hypothetical protein JCM11641_005799 [Rhodosporidiobolus odoratus]